MRLTTSLRRCVTAALVLSSAFVAGVPFAAAGASPSTSTPKTVETYLSFDNNGSRLSSYSAPCKNGRCADSLKIRWVKGQCFDQRTYPPIAASWMYKGLPTARYWPIASPCGVGITLTWSPRGNLNPPTWIKAPDKHQDLVRFPSRADGSTVYFYGGKTASQIQWLKTGKVMGTVTVPPSADDVNWTSEPTVSPNNHPRHASVGHLASPTVNLLGRTGTFSDAATNAAVTSNADGIQFAWFLSLANRGKPYRGCHKVGATWWTDPPVMFEYTSGGALNGRLNVLQCPLGSQGNPVPFNMANFTWAPNLGNSGYNLTSMAASFNNYNVNGGPGFFPQPPPNTDGLYFEFDLDDFQWSYWTNGGTYDGGKLNHPKHVRLVTWRG